MVPRISYRSRSPSCSSATFVSPNAESLVNSIVSPVTKFQLSRHRHFVFVSSANSVGSSLRTAARSGSLFVIQSSFGVPCLNANSKHFQTASRIAKSRQAARIAISVLGIVLQTVGCVRAFSPAGNRLSTSHPRFGAFVPDPKTPPFRRRNRPLERAHGRLRSLDRNCVPRRMKLERTGFQLQLRGLPKEACRDRDRTLRLSALVSRPERKHQQAAMRAWLYARPALFSLPPE